MRIIDTYTKKAVYYDKYRWDYAPEAIDFILRATGAGKEKVVADVGAGTGIMTRHFLPVCKYVYSIEPNGAMFDILSDKFRSYQNWTGIKAVSSETGLEEDSLDVIVAAQAVHWFDAVPTKAEFERILRENGWLVLVRNYGTDQVLGTFISELLKSIYRVGSIDSGHANRRDPDFYFMNGKYERNVFPFEYSQDWDAFLGSLLSASWIPDEDTPLFEGFVKEVRAQFDRMSVDGKIQSQGETEVLIGRLER